MTWALVSLIALLAIWYFQLPLRKLYRGFVRPRGGLVKQKPTPKPRPLPAHEKWIAKAWEGEHSHERRWIKGWYCKECFSFGTGNVSEVCGYCGANSFQRKSVMIVGYWDYIIAMRTD